MSDRRLVVIRSCQTADISVVNRRFQFSTGKHLNSFVRAREESFRRFANNVLARQEEGYFQREQFHRRLDLRCSASLCCTNMRSSAPNRA